MSDTTARNNTLHLKIEGAINEFFKFPKVPADIKHLILDFSSATAFNSFGVHLWIDWVKSLPKNAEVSLTNCPPFIIKQMNIIKDLIPKNGTVISFQIPYYCEKCDLDLAYILEKGKNYSVDDNGNIELQYPEKVTCKNCQNEAQIDVMTQSFFQFLQKNNTKTNSDKS